MTTVSHEPEEGFQSEVPCLTSMDEEAIGRQLDKDEFFWLDLVAPSDEEVARLRDLRLSSTGRRGQPGVRPAPQAGRLRHLRSPRLLRLLARSCGRHRAAARGSPVHLGSLRVHHSPRPAFRRSSVNASTLTAASSTASSSSCTGSSMSSPTRRQRRPSTDQRGNGCHPFARSGNLRSCGSRCPEGLTSIVAFW